MFIKGIVTLKHLKAISKEPWNTFKCNCIMKTFNSENTFKEFKNIRIKLIACFTTF
jgi:hypothetical protein